jgi:hypothetical protein
MRVEYKEGVEATTSRDTIQGLSLNLRIWIGDDGRYAQRRTRRINVTIRDRVYLKWERASRKKYYSSARTHGRLLLLEYLTENMFDLKAFF